MSPFKFPEHPNSNRPDPFVDGDGKNPFSEEEAEEPEPLNSNLFSAPQSDDAEVPYSPVYVQSYEHRGGRILVLGLGGMFFCVLGVVGTVLGIAFTSRDLIDALGFYSFAPLSFFSLVLSWPAWIMGQHDLRAIRAGAMNPEGRPATVWGYYFGVASTLLSIILVGLVIWATFTHIVTSV